MGSPLTMMVVDDNDLDVERVERSVRRLGLETNLVRAVDGVDALEYLRGTTSRSPLSEPRVVLLDLNMPRMTGTEFLEEIRNDDTLRDLRVYVLTTSNRPSDVESTREFGALDYFVKPLRDEHLIKLVEQLNA